MIEVTTLVTVTAGIVAAAKTGVWVVVKLVDSLPKLSYKAISRNWAHVHCDNKRWQRLGYQWNRKKRAAKCYPSFVEGPDCVQVVVLNAEFI